MTQHRNGLPQLGGDTFLTDGGLETTLIFHEGFELPYFAAFTLLDTQNGVDALRSYYERYANIARDAGTGFIFESATWRASPDWGDKLGYSRADLARVNRESIELMAGLRDEYGASVKACVLSGCVGPRGDGYQVSDAMTADEAERYHAHQIGTFAETDADMVSAITMTYADEAIGIARAACVAGIPAALSFTVETDGRLPSGQPLGEAIEQVDAATDASAAYFMINCAHPTHFDTVLEGSDHWKSRIYGVRANASKRSHAELDEAQDLDAGDPVELAERYVELKAHLPKLNVLGGCCGTDHAHVRELSRAMS